MSIDPPRDSPPPGHPGTLAGYLGALSKLRDGLAIALREEDAYWLVLNGTVHVYDTCVGAVGPKPNPNVNPNVNSK